MRFFCLFDERPPLPAVFLFCMPEAALSEVEGHPLWLMNDRLPGPGEYHLPPLCLAQKIVTVTPAPLGQF